jgi:hypothetical protein
MSSHEGSDLAQPFSAQLDSLGRSLEPVVEYWDDVGITQRWASVLEGVERALRELDEAGQRAFLGEVAARLSGWADVSRVLPDTWHSAEALAEHAALARLCRAMILPAGYVVDVEAFAALLSAPELSALTWLQLDGIKLGAAAVEVLCAHRPPAVRTLLLSGCSLGVAGLEVMCGHERLFKGLTRLDLNNNRLTLRGAELLAGCPQLAELKVLSLRANQITMAGRVALGKSVYLSREAKVSAKAIATAQEEAEPAPVAVREVFGDIRSALQQEPSAHGWARICDLVARIDPERATHETIPYVESALAAWPAAQRPVMAAWQERVEQGVEVPPAALLARSMVVSGYGLNAERGERLGRFAAQAGIEQLLIKDGTPSFKALRGLMVESGLSTLRDLTCHCEAVETTLKIFCEEAAYRLERLWLSQVDSDEALDAVVRGPACEGLRGFGMGFTRFGGEPWRALREAPWWWGLESLRLYRATPREATLEQDPLLVTLLGGAEDPEWSRLTRLELMRLPTRSAGSAAVMEGLAARLPALRELLIDRVDPESACWELLEHAPEGVSSLRLTAMGFDDEDAARGFQRARLPGLRSLDLSMEGQHRGAGAEVAQRMLSAECVAGLTSLRLEGVGGDDLWTSLSLRELPKGLTSLSLSSSVMAAASARALADAPLTQLRALRISDARMGAEALRQLVAAGWWAGLESLELYNGYSAEHTGALAVLAGALPPGLKTLRISCGVEEPMLKLLKGGLPEGLRELRLEYGAVASKGFKLLMDMLGSLPELHTLELDNDRIAAKSLPLLLEHPQLGQLAQITMRSNRLGFEGKQMVLDSPVAPIAFKGSI